MKVTVDPNLCIGAAPCVAVAGGVFQLEEIEGKTIAVVIDPHGADDDSIKLAAEACPVRAIFLYEENTGVQIYPSA